MKNLFFLAAFMVMLGIVSCTKDAADAASTTTTTAAATDIDIVAELRGGDESGGNHGGKVHKGTPVNLTDVPQSAKDYAAKNYAGFDIKSAGKRDSAGVVTYHLFLVPKATTTGATPTALVFDASWKFVKVATPRQRPEGEVGGGHGNKGDGHNDGKKGIKGVVTSIALTDIPQAAKDVVTAQAAGYAIEGAVKEDRNGVITYLVRATKTGAKPVLLVFDASWKFVKKIN